MVNPFLQTAEMVCLMVTLGLVIFLASASAKAAPLTNDKTSEVRARWVASQSQRCDKVCAKGGAEAENMLVYTSDGGDIFLCRVRKPPANRFGTNYEDICKVEDPDAPRGTTLERVFECLCIWPKTK